jgi:predicted HicB family RNase H-like nuclease
MNKKYVTISLPVELHKVIKLEAIRRGVSMIQYIAELVKKDQL